MSPLGAAAVGDWRELAECANGSHDPELWFPGDGAYDPHCEAIVICRTQCPVRAQCLEAGLSEDYGTWGGMTARQRRKLRRRRALTCTVGSGRRLRALACMGWSLNEIAERTPITKSGLRHIRSGERPYTNRETVAAITKLYRELSRKVSPGKQQLNVRQGAQAKGWLSPADWAGIDIDDPAATPRQVLAA